MIPEFDSHQEVKDFTAVGMDEKQAEKIVHLFMRGQRLNIEKLATKDDVKQVESGLRKDMEQISINLKFSILKWVLPFLVATTTGIVGILITLLIEIAKKSGGA